MSETRTLTITVCRLVAYLVANTVKDEKEYEEWGLPFIKLSVEAQFGKDQSSAVIEEITSKFCPLIGHGLSLILEDLESEEYTMVHSAEDLLNSILNETESADTNFEETLKQYMDSFFAFIVNTTADEVYDARVRVIARKVCDALNVTGSEFCELENLYWQESLQTNEGVTSSEEETAGVTEITSPKSRKFHEKFNWGCAQVPRSSILASFRIWRVAFIAAGGGALMALSGRLAAPAIVNTVLPLICASNTVGQVAIGMSTVLSCFGISSLELIPGIMSSYGAAIAGRKMLNRTAPLKDFALKPLHLDGTERQEQLQRTGTNGTQGTANGSADTTEDALKRQKQHAPVFILVSGHLERGVDARQLWGADGFLQAAARSTAEELLEEVTKLVTVNITVPSTAGLFAGDRAGDSSAGVNDKDVPSVVSVTTESSVDAARDAGKPAAAAAESTAERTDLNQDSIAPAEESLPVNDAPQTLTEWEELNSQVGGWWREHITHGEEYVLHWEPSVLESLSESLQKILINKMLGKIKGMVKGEILKFTPVPALRAAATLPLMVMDKINELDDPWVIAMDRAHQAGKLLARVLLAEHRKTRARSAVPGSAEAPSTASSARVAGGEAVASRVMGRPITLVGYGMGARLVFHCLETLAAEGGAEARGIVENAVLIGAPVGMEHSKWVAARGVVAGRLVNCYAWNDWMLALLYRSKSYEIGVAGLYPIVLQAGDHSRAVVSTAAAPAAVEDMPAKESTMVGAEMVETVHASSNDANGAVTQTVPPPAPGSSPAPAASRMMGVKRSAGALEVENLDVSHLISSHTDYPNVMPAIIAMLKL